MPTTTPIHILGIPVCNADGVLVERADPARARHLALAPNATVVRKRRGAGAGAVVRILLASAGDDSRVKKLNGNPRRYTYLECSELMPEGVHTLRRLPKSTAGLYRLSVTDCMSTRELEVAA